MNAQRVLIVDTEQQTMAQLAIRLNTNGYHASSTSTLLPIPNNLRNNYYDLIAFGKNISQSVKQCYEDLFRFNNPNILAVTGISPSVPVVADQVSMALNRRDIKDKHVSYINYDINEGRLAVMFRVEKECKAEISLYSTGIFYGTSEKILFSAKLAPGERFIKFKENALSGFGAKFMVIKIDGKVFYMQRL